MKRRWSTRRGAAVVETALITPLILAILFGIIELGSVFFVRHNMVQAARVAARTVAVQDGTSAQGQTAALDQLSDMPSINFSVSITEPPANDPVDRDVVVEISAPLSEAALGDPFGIFSGQTMKTRVVMRKEG